jgi:hypothetical protein
MSKRYADTELAEIANTLDSDDYPSFEIPLSDHLRDNVASLARQRIVKGANRLSLTQWMVRASINGIQYVVGRTSNPETAMRFADMAQMYFWPYRTRQARPPVNNQLNFSVAQAKTDLKEEDIRKVLFQVEELLAARKVLDPEDGKRARLLADTAALRAAGVAVPDAPETTASVRRSLRTEHAELVKRVEVLEKQQSQLIAVLADFRSRLLSTPVCTPVKVC